MRAAAIIPARNEREGLERTLAALPMERLVEVVVVDNGSSDGTGEVARRFGATVVPEPRPGYGRACLAGIARLAEAPEEERPEVVVFLDADGSDDPTELDALLAPLRRSYADAAEPRPAAGARPAAGIAPFAGPRPASPVVRDGAGDEDSSPPGEAGSRAAPIPAAEPDSAAETGAATDPDAGAAGAEPDAGAAGAEPDAGAAAAAGAESDAGARADAATPPDEDPAAPDEDPPPPTGPSPDPPDPPESAPARRPETRAMAEDSGEPLPALPPPAAPAFDASAPLGPGPEGGGAIGFDLVVGSRTRGRMERGAHPVHARWGNRLAAALIRLLYGYRFTDLGPFRAIRWQTLLALGMRDPDYGWTAEMQVKSARARVCAAEVPVSCRRRVGKSKISGTFGGSLLAGLKILLTVVAPPASPEPPAPEPPDGSGGAADDSGDGGGREGETAADTA